jgi:hypothetical protein
MLHATVILEDTIIVAHFNGESNLWDVQLFDSHSGRAATIKWTSEQLGVVLALGVGGDEIAGSDLLYPIAENAVRGLPNEVRPIP